MIWSLQRRGNRLKNFGFSDTLQIVGMTLKFIDSDDTLLSILLLNRDFNDLLREEVLKQALLRSSQELLARKRRNLWLKILRIDRRFIDIEYEEKRQLAELELK